MPDQTRTQVEQLHQAIAALEAQRFTLGDQVVTNAVAILKEQLAVLEAQNLAHAPEQERRMVTILFADLVGSTRFAENMDPEEWHDLLARLQAEQSQIITRNGGAVVRYVGDGLVALFGIPTASENGPERAVRAALEIQSQVTGPRLPVAGYMSQVSSINPEPGDLNRTTDLQPATWDVQLRIGIHTGLVVTGQIGAETHREFTASGDAMNLAARLQSAAPPGGILISHDAYIHVRGVFTMTPQPPLTVKFKSEPLKTYLVHEAKPRPFRTATRGVAGVESATVGRDAEFKQLQTAYLEARDNGRVAWVQLIGEPGIGKSRLMADLQNWTDLLGRPIRILRGRAFEGDQGLALALVRHMWFDRFQISDDMPLAEAKARWVAEFEALSGIADLEPAHVLGLFVGLPFADSPHIGALWHNPSQLQGRALVISREFLRRVRAQMTVEVLLEDLHWADASSLEYLRAVLLAPGEIDPPGLNGMFILGTARPDDKLLAGLESYASQIGPGAAPAPRFDAIHLSRLTDDAIRTLAVDLLRHVQNLPNTMLDLIVERAEGVPYFAEELINWFIDRGVIDRKSEPWRFVPEHLAELPLPATLQQLLLTRLWTLRESERSALQRGAIFGRRFWAGGIEALGTPHPNETLGALQPRGLVDLQPESAFQGELEWSFQHALLRDVTYESVLKRERPNLHRAAAQWLEAQATRAGRQEEFAGIIGEHCERAGELGMAAGWYIQAGERARMLSALAEAQHFFDRALELAAPTDRETQWRARLGRAAVLDLRGAWESQQGDLAVLLDLAADDPYRRAQVHYLQARRAWGQSDYAAAEWAADDTCVAAQQIDDQSLQVRAMGIKTAALTRLGEWAAAQQMVEETLARVQTVRDDAAVAFALDRVNFYYHETGDLALAAQWSARAVELAHRAGDRGLHANALTNLGVIYSGLGLFELARTTQEQAVAQHQALGSRRGRAYSLMNLGWIYSHLGNTARAYEFAEQALAEVTAIGEAWGKGACLQIIGEIAEQDADYIRAEACFAAACAEFERLSHAPRSFELRAGLARCALVQRQLDKASRMAVDVWDYTRAHGPTGFDWPVRVYETVATVFLQAGRPEATEVIEAGYRELMTSTNRITDPEWRRSAVENFPENRAMVALWETRQKE